jgi:hypothetical protein
MRTHTSRTPLALAAGTALLLTAAFGHLTAQTPGPQAAGGGRGGGGRGGIAPALFRAIDGDKDGAVTRDEFKGAFDKWFTEWDATGAGSLSGAQIGDGLTRVAAAFAPPAPPPQLDACGGRSGNPRVACPADVDKMIAALPDSVVVHDNTTTAVKRAMSASTRPHERSVPEGGRQMAGRHVCRLGPVAARPAAGNPRAHVSPGGAEPRGFS